MRSTQRCCLRAVAMIVFSALIALPAAAITEDEMMAICQQWIENYPNNDEWAETCDQAIQEWESQQPPVVMVNQMKYPPNGPFPTQETGIAAGPNGGDYSAIAQT